MGVGLQSAGGVHASDRTGTATATLLGELVGQSRRRQQVRRQEGERDGWEGGEDCRRVGGAPKYKPGLHQPSFQAFCLFDAHRAGSMIKS